jgi:hypothetical protein
MVDENKTNTYLQPIVQMSNNFLQGKYPTNELHFMANGQSTNMKISSDGEWLNIKNNYQNGNTKGNVYIESNGMIKINGDNTGT